MLLPKRITDLIKNLNKVSLSKDLVGILILLGLLTLFSFIKGFGIKYIKDKTIVDFRIDLTNSFFRQSYISNDLPNEYITHVSNETNDIGTAVSEDLIGIISNGIIASAMFIMILKVNFVASMFILIIVFIIGIIALWGTTFIKRSSVQVQSSQTLILSKIKDYIMNYKIILVFSLCDFVGDKLNFLRRKVFKEIRKRDALYSLILPIVNLCIYALLITLLLLIIVMFHNISQEKVIAYAFYVVMLVASFASFVDGMGKMQDHSGALERLHSLIGKFELDNRLLNKENEVLKVPIDFYGESIGFRYEKERWVFKNINFKISSGSHVAIRGKSGAGKTTFIEILLKFLKPTTGRIYCGGIPLSEISKNSLYNKIAVVFQDPLLLDTTIRKNIDPTNTMTDSELLSILVKVGIDINKLDSGLNTRVENGATKVSRGQAQRISLARALAKKPEVLILDEVTASVDKDTAVVIENTIKELDRNVTVIFTSHDMNFLHDFVDEIVDVSSLN